MKYLSDIILELYTLSSWYNLFPVIERVYFLLTGCCVHALDGYVRDQIRLDYKLFRVA